ncbi:MAG: hypothetical protein IKA76_03995 [Clostridia bacterium]|nr:hypothetical protein [Clostridia bacterium]
MIQTKKRNTLMKRRTIASIVALGAVLILLLATVIVQNLVSVTPWDDVDGTRYYIRREDGVYGLYDENKVPLIQETVYKYYVTSLGTLVGIDDATGAVKEVITVDNIFSAEGNEVENTKSHRIQIFPHMEKKNILSIEVFNEHGDFTFYRFDTVKNKIDKTADFVIKGAPATAYDPELFAGLYVDAGYTLSTMKLVNPIHDANGAFSEYGLVSETRTRPLTDEDGTVLKDENGNPLTEEYRYEPAYFIITDLDGNRHKIIVGDALLTGKGYYAQYVDLSGDQEVKRDAVYVLSSSLKESILAPIEDFLTPMITYPLGMMTYMDVQNFVVRKLEHEKGADGLFSYKPIVSFSFVDISERENTIWASHPFYFDDVEFMDEILSMKGYTPNTDNINSSLRDLYDPEYVDVIRLNPTDEEMVKYGLYELLTDASGNPILNEKGFPQYTPASQYTIAFDYTVDDGEDPNLCYTHSHLVLVSKKNDQDNYYVYTFIKTTGYEKQKDGSLKEIRGYTYTYDIIVEVAGHSLEFVEWDTMKWVSRSIVQDNIAFIDRIDIESPDYNAYFKLDNSASDQTTTSSEFLKVKAKDSLGRELTTFNFLEFKDNSSDPKGPFTWRVTANDIQVFDKDGNKASINSGVCHYEYNNLGNQVLVVGSNNGKISGTKVWVHANEIVTAGTAGEKTYVRYSTNLFRLLYQSLFYTEIINSYEVSSEEEAALTEDSNLIMRLTIYTKDRDGTKNKNVYAFYRISSRKAYITINGNGGFYVQADRIEKLLSDTQKFFNYEPIDPLAKT